LQQLEENISDLSYSNVFSQPLGFGLGAGPRVDLNPNTLTQFNSDVQLDGETTVLDPRLPPTHPSVGIALPKLPKLFEPNTAETRLKNGGKDRLKYYGFAVYCAGPTDESCWLAPGLIAMGSIPFGFARINSSIDSVSALMMSGIGTFVSLLGEDEERQLEVNLYFYA